MAPRVPALAREALVLLADRFGATDRNQSVQSENAIMVQSECNQSSLRECNQMQSDAIQEGPAWEMDTPRSKRRV
jgi:hypothetical protein